MADLDVVPGCLWFLRARLWPREVRDCQPTFLRLCCSGCENSFEIGARLVEIDLFRVSGCYSLFNKRNEVFLVLEFGAPVITEQLV